MSTQRESAQNGLVVGGALVMVIFVLLLGVASKLSHHLHKGDVAVAVENTATNSVAK